MSVIRLLLILLFCSLVGCSEAPRATTLVALGNAQRDFDGRLVQVSGTLRTFDEPRHYWIENAALDRVALTDVDEAVLADLVGQSVEVSGRFRYDQRRGRRIEVATLNPLP